MNGVEETIIGLNGCYDILAVLMWMVLVIVNPIAFSNNRLAEAPFIVVIVLASLGFLLGLVVLATMLGLTGGLMARFRGSTGSKRSAEATSITDYVYSLCVGVLFTSALVPYLSVEYDVYNNMSDWIFIVDIVIVSIIWFMSVVYGLYLIGLAAGVGTNTASYVRDNNVKNGV